MAGVGGWNEVPVGMTEGDCFSWGGGGGYMRVARRERDLRSPTFQPTDVLRQVRGDFTRAGLVIESHLLLQQLGEYCLLLCVQKHLS